MKSLFTCTFLFYFSLTFGQILNHSKGELFTEDPRFNPTFIKNNKIKSIKGYYSTKADYDRIRPTNNVYVYEFNQEGYLVQDYKTIRRDTIVRAYEYDKNHNLIVLRQSDQYGFQSFHYTYDSLNRLIEKEYRRDVNHKKSKVDFDLGESYIISKHTFGYENVKAGLKKSYFNSLGKVYQTEIFYADINGYLYKQESRSLTGVGSAKTDYQYNEMGLLRECKTETVLNSKSSSRIKIEYDNNENIMAQHYYRNGVYKTEFQIVYNSENMLLNALLSRDIETNVITILKFADYTFFKD
ncbi:hypothetical protein DNU06_10410 [Putridiphycobacter roseus]|uniref:Uncharacterized protein n=1 Tax=Putridiphycobacter roseus TaxID=2219161 RepID=A0A2W1NCP5_9FLAO|nr:hypothetical protein [Putridiphycobacter roseus]PZE17145.1 hypothetical protein DNU06_10410 [Putridiphycobacter roseus]